MPDYGKIVMRNWAQFSDVFANKRMFQQNITDVGRLRNLLKHNREVDDVARLHGRAACTWLEKALAAFASALEATNTDDEAETSD